MLNAPFIHAIQKEKQVYIVLVNYWITLRIIGHEIFPGLDAFAPELP